MWLILLHEHITGTENTFSDQLSQLLTLCARLMYENNSLDFLSSAFMVWSERSK